MKAAVSVAALFVVCSALALTQASLDPLTYKASAEPSALMLTFATDAHSRGFAWQTDDSVQSGEVRVLEGTFGAADEAAFLKDGRTVTATSKQVASAGSTYHSAVVRHKALVTNLRFGATYSYRLGGEGHFIYGTFSLPDVQDEVTIVNFTDAQPKQVPLFYQWENTASNAAVTVGSQPDFILYGGDFYDENAPALKGSKYQQWAISTDMGVPYFPGVPWALSPGNHDWSVYDATTAIQYDKTIVADGNTMGCQSVNYGRVHLVTLPYLGGWNAANYGQVATWLDEDLKQANAAGLTDWTIVAMHWGVYVTGDHFVDVAGSQDLLKMFAPIMSSNHVDLVVQGHDHVFTKTLPYRWDAAGVTTTFLNDEVVNLKPATETVNGVTYDKDPNGTYYICCGAAGHRVGDGNEIYANAELGNAKCYRNMANKIETGTINIDTSAHRPAGITKYGVGDNYRAKGDNASADLSATMFGVLKVKGDTLAYDFYVVETNGLSAPVLFDTLRVKKTMSRAQRFSITPYLQHPATNAMSLIWFTREPGTARLIWRKETDAAGQEVITRGIWAEALTNNPSATTTDNGIWGKQYKHRSRLTGLEPATRYVYAVELDGMAYTNSFKTAPRADDPIRIIYYNDPETTPIEKKTTDWVDPVTGKNRTYFITKNEGYASNIVHMVARKPDLYIVAGDLAGSGGWQMDWDSYWQHNAGGLGLGYNDPVGSVPMIAAVGNHDLKDTGGNFYFGAKNYISENKFGGEAALPRYLTYFEFEPNGVNYLPGDGETYVGNDRDRSQLFHRLDFGPVTIITLDTNNGDDSDPERDTNTGLFRDPANEYGFPPGRSPDFNPGSKQYTWLTNNLADAQKKAQFTFVVNHQCPYSVGYHNRTNIIESNEWLSARAVRILGDTLIKYGVDAWLCGHDEMMEHSRISGKELRPDGTSREQKVEIFDTGTAGDGLRGGKITKADNPCKVYSAHYDCPEVWENGILISGGKHYGHMEIDVKKVNGAWTCTLTPVYIFVSQDASGKACKFERRVYDDVVTLTSARRAFHMILY